MDGQPHVICWCHMTVSDVTRADGWNTMDTIVFRLKWEQSGHCSRPGTTFVFMIFPPINSSGSKTQIRTFYYILYRYTYVLRHQHHVTTTFTCNSVRVNEKCVKGEEGWQRCSGRWKYSPLQSRVIRSAPDTKRYPRLPPTPRRS